jgi:hypothetical protein
MNVHTLEWCRRNGRYPPFAVRFGDLLVGYDSNGNSRLRGESDEHLLSSKTTVSLKRRPPLITAMIKTVAALHVARGKI